MVYCELKSAVAAVRLTFTVPDPVSVPAPFITSAAAGVNVPLTVCVPAVLKPPEAVVVPPIVALLKASVPLLLMDDPLFSVIVPPLGEKFTLPFTVNAPPTAKLVLYCDCAVGVAAIVNPLKVSEVPLFEMVDPTADMVTVPAEGLNVAVELFVRVPATLKLLEVVTVAPEAIVSPENTSVPLFAIDDPLFIVIVPPLGEKFTLPLTVNAPATL